jgi:hypothetical protein
MYGNPLDWGKSATEIYRDPHDPLLFSAVQGIF